MKKFKTEITCCFIAIVLLSACSKEPADLARLSGESGPETKVVQMKDAAYDGAVLKIAKSIAVALKDQDFRKLLKAEALKAEDGDYEVLLHHFKNKVDGQKHPGILNSLKSHGNSTDKANILEKYPEIQIAVRAGIEKWDADNFHPYVVYLTSVYEENDTQVPAISPDGKIVMLDATKEPPFPVIVVNKNERCDRSGNILSYYKQGTHPVKSGSAGLKSALAAGFSSFTAKQAAGSIAVNLNWTYSSDYPGWDNEGSFDIFRDDLDGNGYLKIASVSYWERVYNDVNVLPSKSYSYMIRAKIPDGYAESAYANVYISAIPEFTTDLTVDNTAPQQMELHWSIANISNWTNLQVQRNNGITGFVKITDLPVYSTSYTDQLVTPSPAYGVEYTYKLVATYAPTGICQSFYCDEFLANRVSNQWLRISRIQFNSFDNMRSFEPWTLGAPEVVMSMSEVLPDGKVNTFYENLGIGGVQSAGWNINMDLAQWNRKTNGLIWAVVLVEWDGGFKGELEFEVAQALKAKTDFGVESATNFGFRATIENPSLNDYIGKGYIYYWDNANGTTTSVGSKCKITTYSHF